MTRRLTSLALAAMFGLGSVTPCSEAAVLSNNANLELWLRADMGVVTDGLGNVTQWQDQSGNARHAAPGSGSNNRPPSLASNVFNGQPALEFNSAGSEFLIPMLPTAGSNATTLVVYEGTGKILVTRWQNRTFHLQANSSSQYTFRARPSGGGATEYSRNFTSYSGARIGVASYEFGTPSYDLRVGVNGTFTSFAPASPWGEAGAPANPAIGMNGDATGDAYDPGESYYNGHIAEIIYFNRVLNAAERIILENHLSAKYGAPLATAADKYAGDTLANGNYDRDVIGIGAESDGDNLGSGLAGLTVTANTLDAGDYLLAGHKVETNSLVVDAADGILLKRSDRVWYLDKTGTLDATLTFDFSELGIAPPKQTDFHLLYSATNAFDFTILDTVTLVGGQAIFTLGNALLQDGYYTVAAIPEPASLALLGLAGLLARRRRV